MQVTKRDASFGRVQVWCARMHVSALACAQVSVEPAVFLEVENEVTSAAGSRLSQLRCSRDGREWNTLLPASVVAAAGSG